ncbi:MAG: cyclic nucleotide-binding domain-containing protein [Actinobacteria bacterium]|nr:cyclic nucleotide-binding domain-containing protein [Actinomycetota bacterium]
MDGAPPLFFGAQMSGAEAERRMIVEVDRTLSSPARTIVPAGTRLLSLGDPVDRIWIVLDGQVQLTRTVDGREVVFHERTAGRLVGLLAMARGEPAYFDTTAVTDLTTITLTLEDLDRALRGNPVLESYFITVLLRSLARRHLRAVELRVEVDRLNRDLAADRDRLERALADLEAAQAQMVEQASMATLGQLAAGIGHELNNPIAAIQRAADFLTEDLAALVESAGADAPAGRFLQRALTRPPVSTRDEREQRRVMAEHVGDDDLARRLVAVGVGDSSEFEAVFGGLDAAHLEEALATVERYHGLGTSLRNIRSAAARIGGLTGSLRSYARPGRELTPGIDVREGIEETLLLLGHELRGIEVIREYDDVPGITVFAGQVNQVWTNLIHNAAREMGGAGTLTVRTAAVPEGVRVEVADTGPAIAPEHLEEVFDMHFTTHGGRVDFGLGLGLRLCKDIVARHGGSIEVESAPGDTRFIVTLPVEPPEGLEVS